MNFFELFEIPVQLKMDTEALYGKYLELSRRYHPDYFVSQPEDAQAEALEKTALVNKAFTTFQNPDETLKYVLRLKGLLEEEEKYALPPDFLMEVLDINEQLMDAERGAGKGELQGFANRIAELQDEIYEPVKKIVEHYKEGITSEEELLQVKEYYYKKKYLDRLRRELGAD